MKTAVELFKLRLIQRRIGYREEDFKEAKEMEKEQLRNAFLAGGKSRDNLFKGLEFQTIEEYIEETFKSE